MAQHRAPFTLLKRKTPKGKTIWYYRLASDPKRVPHSTGKNTKWEAKQFVEDLLSTGQMTETSILLKEYAKDFFVHAICNWTKRRHAQGFSISEPMSNMRRGHLSNHILPAFGDLPLYDLNPVQIENWLLELDLSHATKNHIRSTMDIVLNEARRARLISTNPVADVGRLSKSQYKKRDSLSLQDVKTLFPNDEEKLLHIWRRPDFVVLYFLMLSSGIRSGEARALQWKHVIWEQQGILINQAVKADGSIGDPKAKEIRAIVLPCRAIDLLRWWIDRCVHDEPEDFIFHSKKRGTPISGEAITSGFKAALKKAEIEVGDRNLVAHSLRHTYNTIMKGILTAEMLREFTGHRSEEMTDRYDNPYLLDRLKQFQSSRKLIDSTWDL
jgi:integrase